MSRYPASDFIEGTRHRTTSVATPPVSGDEEESRPPEMSMTPSRVQLTYQDAAVFQVTGATSLPTLFPRGTDTEDFADAKVMLLKSRLVRVLDLGMERGVSAIVTSDITARILQEVVDVLATDQRAVAKLVPKVIAASRQDLIDGIPADRGPQLRVSDTAANGPLPRDFDPENDDFPLGVLYDVPWADGLEETPELDPEIRALACDIAKNIQIHGAELATELEASL